MPIAHAMWTHGHSIHIEYLNRMNDIRRAGGFIRLDGDAGSTNWFHAAIPTAVIVDDNRLHIRSVMLRFRTSGASIANVHIYDGATKIASHDGLNLSPDNWIFQRFDIPDNPKIRWGLGISFMGKFGSGTLRRIEVSAAGADFSATQP